MRILRLTPGDDVRIYHDPMRRETLDGWARLVELVWHNDEWSCWIVRYGDETAKVMRMIHCSQGVLSPESRLAWTTEEVLAREA